MTRDTERMIERLTAVLSQYRTADSKPYDDALALRRISMTLQRWHELECGDSNNYGAWAIVRGKKAPAQWAIKHANNPGVWWDGEMWATENRRKIYSGRPGVSGIGVVDHMLEFGKRVRLGDGPFIYDDDGSPFIERHYYNHGKGPDSVEYYATPDRERGARKRLQAILARYPGLTAYVQTDPRGCSLYILRPGDIPADSDPSCCYTNGLAVYR